MPASTFTSFWSSAENSLPASGRKSSSLAEAPAPRSIPIQTIPMRRNRKNPPKATLLPYPDGITDHLSPRVPGRLNPGNLQRLTRIVAQNLPSALLQRAVGLGVDEGGAEPINLVRFAVLQE